MFFAYVDESGDSGYEQSPTRMFTLATVLVDDRQWLDTLDQLVSFRRYLKDNFGLPPRAELKAVWIIHNKGSFKALGVSFEARMNLYRACMRFQRKCGAIRTFAVVVNKDQITDKSRDPRTWAWTYTIQRLERWGSSQQQNTHLFPDEGHGQFIRKKLREMRRFHQVPSAYGDELIDRKATNIVEDPSERKSQESYFVQMADLNAYAASRKLYPGPNIDGSLWDELGDARIGEVNRLRGGPTGIVS